MASNDFSVSLQIALRELGDLAREKTLVAANIITLFALPIYLGRLAASSHLSSTRAQIWALALGVTQVFITATSALQSLAVEREQRTLIAILLTPADERAIFIGKTLTPLILAALEGILSAVLFMTFSAYKVSVWGLMHVSALSFTTATLSAAWGVVLGSLIASSRTIGLVVTLLALVFSVVEFNVNVWTIVDKLGQKLMWEVVLSQLALAAAAYFLASLFYKRRVLIRHLW